MRGDLVYEKLGEIDEDLIADALPDAVPLLGMLMLGVIGQGSLNIATCGIIMACYTLGAAMAVLLTVRVNVMEILRDKE